MCFEEWDTSQESTSVSPDRNLVRFRVWRKKKKLEIIENKAKLHHKNVLIEFMNKFRISEESEESGSSSSDNLSESEQELNEVEANKIVNGRFFYNKFVHGFHWNFIDIECKCSNGNAYHR